MAIRVYTCTQAYHCQRTHARGSIEVPQLTLPSRQITHKWLAGFLKLRLSQSLHFVRIQTVDTKHNRNHTDNRDKERVSGSGTQSRLRSMLEAAR